MIITRNKFYSDSGYLGDSLRQNVNLSRVEEIGDDLVYRIADVADAGLDYAANSNPIVDKATSKVRKRISGFTKPIKKLITLKRKRNKNKGLE